jgi:hypothetical protein
MHKFTVIVRFGNEVVANAETGRSATVSGAPERVTISGIGKVAQEIQTLKSAPDTVTLSGLSFSNLEALGAPTNLCQALNGREFDLEVFDFEHPLARYPRCVAMEPGNYLMTAVDNAAAESVEFSILADLPLP